MLKNHLKVALRNLGRNRFYASINIVGLSIAIACCLVAYMSVNYAIIRLQAGNVAGSLDQVRPPGRKSIPRIHSITDFSMRTFPKCCRAMNGWQCCSGMPRSLP